MELNKQMELFGDGGLKDEGGSIDPVSGNDVPSGSLKKEVRDDIDAKVSEGEFVFPADVVRYWGLDTLMTMRQKAKAGLEKMEMMGQMGNSDEAVLPDDIPFTADDIDFEDNEPMMFNTGGLGTSVTSQFANYSQSPQQYNPSNYTGIAPVQYLNSTGTAAFNIPNLPVVQNPVVTNPVVTNPTVTTNIPGQTTSFTDLMNHVYREYINKTTGDRIQIRIVNGQPISPIPEGYELYIPETETGVVTDTTDAVTTDETTDTTTTDTTDVGTDDTTDVTVDTDAVTVTSNQKDNDRNEPDQQQLVKTSTLLNDPRFSDNSDAITLMSNGREVSMPADNYNALLVSYGRLKDTGAFDSLQEYYDLPLGDKLSLIPQELKSAFGYEVDAETVKRIVEEAKASGNMGKTGIPLLDGIMSIANNIFGGGKKENETVNTNTGAVTTNAATTTYEDAIIRVQKKRDAEKAAAEAKAKADAAAAAEQMAKIQAEAAAEQAKVDALTSQGVDYGLAKAAVDKKNKDDTPTYTDTSSIEGIMKASGSNNNNNNDKNNTPTYTDTSSIEGIMKASGSSDNNNNNSSSNITFSSVPVSSNKKKDKDNKPSSSFSFGNAPVSSNTSNAISAGQMAGKGYVGGYGFNEGGLASKPKAKPKTKRNRKKGLGGNS